MSLPWEQNLLLCYEEILSLWLSKRECCYVYEVNKTWLRGNKNLVHGYFNVFSIHEKLVYGSHVWDP